MSTPITPVEVRETWSNDQHVDAAEARKIADGHRAPQMQLRTLFAVDELLEKHHLGEVELAPTDRQTILDGMAQARLQSGAPSDYQSTSANDVTVGFLNRLNVPEKVELAIELLDGWTGGADEKAIIRIVDSLSDTQLSLFVLGLHEQGKLNQLSDDVDDDNATELWSKINGRLAHLTPEAVATLLHHGREGTGVLSSFGQMKRSEVEYYFMTPDARAERETDKLSAYLIRLDESMRNSLRSAQYKEQVESIVKTHTYSVNNAHAASEATVRRVRAMPQLEGEFGERVARHLISQGWQLDLATNYFPNLRPEVDAIAQRFVYENREGGEFELGLRLMDTEFIQRRSSAERVALAERLVELPRTSRNRAVLSILFRTSGQDVSAMVRALNASGQLASLDNTALRKLLVSRVNELDTGAAAALFNDMVHKRGGWQEDGDWVVGQVTRWVNSDDAATRAKGQAVAGTLQEDHSSPVRHQIGRAAHDAVRARP